MRLPPQQELLYASDSLPSQRRPVTLLVCLQFVPKKGPSKKPFDWGAPMAPGPATANTPPPAEDSTAPTGAPAAAPEPTSPTIALLDTLLEVSPATPEREADPASAADRASTPAAADGSAPKSADGAADGSTGGGTGGSGEAARPGEQRPARGSETGAEAVDVSRTATAQSSLISFAVSLVVLAWAGTVGSTGAPPPL